MRSPDLAQGAPVRAESAGRAGAAETGFSLESSPGWAQRHQVVKPV